MDKKIILPGELFRLALCVEFKNRGWGSQSRLADKIGMSRPQMNDIVKGRAAGPEEQRVRIAQELGFKYEDMLAQGREILEGQAHESYVHVPGESPIRKDMAPRMRLAEEKAFLLERAMSVVEKISAQKGEFSSVPKVSSIIGFYRKFLARKEIHFVFDENIMRKALLTIDTFDPKEILGIEDLLSTGEWVLEIYKIYEKEESEK